MRLLSSPKIRSLPNNVLSKAMNSHKTPGEIGETVRGLASAEAGFRQRAGSMTKKAMMGALLGGAVGYNKSGPTVASKVMNTAVGAGIGHLGQKVVERVARGTKNQVWDQQRSRQERDIYGYQPSTVTQPAENFVG